MSACNLIIRTSILASFSKLQRVRPSHQHAIAGGTANAESLSARELQLTTRVRQLELEVIGYILSFTSPLNLTGSSPPKATPEKQVLLLSLFFWLGTFVARKRRILGLPPDYP